MPEVEKKATADVTVRPSEQFAAFLQRRATESEGQRSYDVAAQQLDRMLTAESLDDIMDADEQGTYQARDLVNLRLTIEPGFRVNKSSEKFEAPLGVYIQFNATANSDMPERGIEKGQELVISTGAPLLIGKIRSLEAGGYLPLAVRIIGIAAPNGTVLKLRRDSES